MDDLFGQIDFGSLDAYLKNDDVTDISYTNNGAISNSTTNSPVLDFFSKCGALRDKKRRISSLL